MESQAKHFCMTLFRGNVLPRRYMVCFVLTNLPKKDPIQLPRRYVETRQAQTMRKKKTTVTSQIPADHPPSGYVVQRLREQVLGQHPMADADKPDTRLWL